MYMYNSKHGVYYKWRNINDLELVDVVAKDLGPFDIGWLKLDYIKPNRSEFV